MTTKKPKGNIYYLPKWEFIKEVSWREADKVSEVTTPELFKQKPEKEGELLQYLRLPSPSSSWRSRIIRMKDHELIDFMNLAFDVHNLTGARVEEDLESQMPMFRLMGCVTQGKTVTPPSPLGLNVPFYQPERKVAG